MAFRLRSENLYAKGYVITLPDGRQLLKRDKPSYTPLANKDRTHVIREGDKPWILGYRYYKDDKRWHLILDVNRMFNPFELEVGREIVIPDLDVIRAGQ